MLEFLIGVVVGTFFGIFICALLGANERND